MVCELNTAAYMKLIDEDLEWLLAQPRSLERDHIEQCLNWLRSHRPKTAAIKMSDVFIGNRQLTSIEAEVLEAAIYRCDRRPNHWHEAKDLYPSNDNASTSRRTALSRLSSMGALKQVGIESRSKDCQIIFRRMG
jgi:hypothetical protein